MNSIKLFSSIRPNLNRRGEHQWRFGLADRIVTVSVATAGSSTTAERLPVTANFNPLKEKHAFIFGVRALFATLLRLTSSLFVINPRSKSLQSKSDSFITPYHRIPLP